MAMPTPTIGENKMNEISRAEIKSVIDKSVELRALHAALMHGNTTTNTTVSQFSAENYPVFTPSYEDLPLSMYNQISSESGPLCSEHWDYYDPEDQNSQQCIYTKENASSDTGFPCSLTRLDSHICPVTTLDQTSPKTELTTSSCNKCKPATIITESNHNVAASKFHVPLTESHSSYPKNRVMNLYKFLPRFKKKNKTEPIPSVRTESERTSQSFRDFDLPSIEALKRDLMEANEVRDKALVEVMEMRSSYADLKRKLEHLETYCEDLKEALQNAANTSNVQVHESKYMMPVTQEATVEGFLEIVSEARVSVKQFCKILIDQFEEGDNTALTALLQAHKLSVNSKYSKGVLYHLEAIVNQQLYQNFENCVFKKSGSQKHLDPQMERVAQFSSFVGLRNLSWNEVMKKGTKCYSEEFSNFCDEKMSCLILALNWTKVWPEQLLQTFFVSAKCVWLLHLLAFSFNPPIGILRVDENRGFDSSFMEDLLADKQRLHGSSRVKIMVMPGFYVQDKVLRCKVICRYKSAT